MNQIINVSLEDLKLAENNVRLHPKRQIEEYKRSLTKFGQTKNAVIDEDNNVLIGNGLVIAARELGWEEIYAIQRNDYPTTTNLKSWLVIIRFSAWAWITLMCWTIFFTSS